MEKGILKSFLFHIVSLMIVGGFVVIQAQAADLVLHNARIYTLNENQSWATALAVKDGKLIFVGDEGFEAFIDDLT